MNVLGYNHNNPDNKSVLKEPIMKFINSISLSAILIITVAATVLAAPADIFTRKIQPAKNLLVFPNAKGEVVFSHLKHLRSLNEDQCILCHLVENPTLESIQSRFDNHRVAHQYCKGCHLKGKGPTECNQCHNYKKTADRH
jgi:hypothetical protein